MIRSTSRTLSQDLLLIIMLLLNLYKINGFSTPPVSQYLYQQSIEQLYTDSSTKIKCPFIKRRVADTLDNLSLILQFVSIRHKSLDVLDLGLMPGCRESMKADVVSKRTGLTIEEVGEIIKNDWLCNKYYITGKLTKDIYRNDCLFEGPDPDMPVRGLRKYVDAASKLFDRKVSKAELLSYEFDVSNKTVKVNWRISGVLMLPWHPKVHPWTGTTTYYINDEEGLIYLHKETWDISVVRAFVSTVLPTLAEKIWSENNDKVSSAHFFD